MKDVVGMEYADISEEEQKTKSGKRAMMRIWLS